MTNLKNILQNITIGWKKLDLNDPAVDVWVLRAEREKQIVLMHFHQNFISNEFHTNDCSQWGIVLNGKMTLWTDQKKVFKKGDIFVIPKGMPHRVKIKAGYKDLTVFNGLRYKPRPSIKERREK